MTRGWVHDERIVVLGQNRSTQRLIHCIHLSSRCAILTAVYDKCNTKWKSFNMLYVSDTRYISVHVNTQQAGCNVTIPIVYQLPCPLMIWSITFSILDYNVIRHGCSTKFPPQSKQWHSPELWKGIWPRELLHMSAPEWQDVVLNLSTGTSEFCNKGWFALCSTSITLVYIPMGRITSEMSLCCFRQQMRSSGLHRV